MNARLHTPWDGPAWFARAQWAGRHGFHLGGLPSGIGMRECLNHIHCAQIDRTTPAGLDDLVVDNYGETHTPCVTLLSPVLSSGPTYLLKKRRPSLLSVCYVRVLFYWPHSHPHFFCPSSWLPLVIHAVDRTPLFHGPLDDYVAPMTTSKRSVILLCRLLKLVPWRMSVIGRHLDIMPCTSSLKPILPLFLQPPLNHLVSVPTYRLLNPYWIKSSSFEVSSSSLHR